MYDGGPFVEEPVTVDLAEPAELSILEWSCLESVDGPSSLCSALLAGGFRLLNDRVGHDLSLPRSTSSEI